MPNLDQKLCDGMTLAQLIINVKVTRARAKRREAKVKTYQDACDAVCQLYDFLDTVDIETLEGIHYGQLGRTAKDKGRVGKSSRTAA